MIGGIVLSVDFQNCSQCPGYTEQTAHAIIINNTVLLGLMIFLNVWLIWGILKVQFAREGGNCHWVWTRWYAEFPWNVYGL